MIFKIINYLAILLAVGLNFVPSDGLPVAGEGQMQSPGIVSPPTPPPGPAPLPVPPTPPPKPAPDPVPVPPPVVPPDEPPVVTNSVDGLELPSDFTVDPAKHTLFRVSAKTTGQVQFFVFGTSAIEYDLGVNSVIVGVPREAGVIVVIATALIKDAANARQTPFCKTVITVNAGPIVDPPGPGPIPTPKGKLYGMIIEDPAARTAEIATLINSLPLRTSLGGPTMLKVLDPRDPYMQRKPKGDARTFDAIVKTIGLPAFLILDEAGKVYPYPLPKTEAEALAIIAKLRGP
jgi:hypothetical protein